mmetsp:Transcript_5629/g.6463  ORF Transcript_5629/g.6463 Transcript_5629/m.6463 type:complete len:84 (+) Transcript_5629:279-530(+)
MAIYPMGRKFINDATAEAPDNPPATPTYVKDEFCLFIVSFNVTESSNVGAPVPVSGFKVGFPVGFWVPESESWVGESVIVVGL